jgi:integrase
MIALELHKSGNVKLHASWEQALCYCLRYGRVRLGENVPATGAGTNDPERRARDFASQQPADALRALLELAEGASDAEEYDAAEIYQRYWRECRQWIENPVYVDVFADPFADPALTVAANGELDSRKHDGSVDTFTDAELADILAEASPDKVAGCRFRAMVSLMVASGLRIGEAIRLTPASITPGPDGWLLVKVGAERGNKTGSRVVPVRELDIQPMLSQWIAMRPEDKTYLFCTHGSADTFVHPNAFNRALQEYARRAGITHRVHAHMFRHTFASNKATTLQPHELQALLGHKSASMSMHYCHTSTTRLIAALER